MGNPPHLLPANPPHPLQANPLRNPHLLLPRLTLATNPLYLLLGSALTRRLLRGPPSSPVSSSMRRTEWRALRRTAGGSANGSVAAAIVDVSLSGKRIRVLYLLEKR